MPVKAVVIAISLVLLIVMAVVIIEFFVPLSAKLDMDMYCREAMIKMEMDGGLASDVEDCLESRLIQRGFANISIQPVSWVRQGEELVLHVEADFNYSSLTALYNRSSICSRMVWERTACARKVVN